MNPAKAISSNKDFKYFLKQYKNLSEAISNLIPNKSNHLNQKNNFPELEKRIKDLINQYNKDVKAKNDEFINIKVEKQKALSSFLADYGFDKKSKEEHSFILLSFLDSNGKSNLFKIIKSLNLPFITNCDKNKFNGDTWMG